MSKFLKLLFLVIIAISTFYASWFALHGDIVFHTDIARDFLLIEDIVKNKPITLIGPRSGGIPGVFHGPLWTYLNAPAFILGGGNPAIVGWFWVLLYAVNVYIIYKVGKSMFNQETGLIAAALTSTITAFSVPGFFNPFGAVMAAPVFFYFFYKYVRNKNVKDLLISLFTLGLVIQFQMAFGVPILVLLLPVLIFLIIKNKKFSHLSALLILLIPLSTFILFDLKHQFLQTKSVINYVTGKENTGKVDRSFSDVLNSRVKSIMNDGPGFITKDNQWLFYLFMLLSATALYKVYTDKKYKDKKSFYLLLFYFYIGYWLMTVLYKGVMWGYYYWPFLSLVTLFSASFYNVINKKFILVVFLVFAIFNLYTEYKRNFKPVAYFGSDGSSWLFHYNSAKKIFTDAPSEFGYYIFTADQFGYSSRYAMDYAQSQNVKKAFPYEKKTITYLMIAPSNNPTIDDGWWKKEKVKINRNPERIFNFPNSNFRIEKYQLTAEEVEDKSDDNLIHTLIFR